MSSTTTTNIGRVENSTNQVRTLDSQSILAGKKQVVIQHGDNQYRLCVTKENKLILTK
ncbi:hemin uptake protein HemP [Thiomicrospira sp.]|uniref:hemin uptake protein HemP n=1 Tax=Thiomicrospira sp. TaxID=935 RepID=UPI002F93E9E9